MRALTVVQDPASGSMRDPRPVPSKRAKVPAAAIPLYSESQYMAEQKDLTKKERRGVRTTGGPTNIKIGTLATYSIARTIL